MTVQMIPVQSSNITHIGHDETGLHVHFKGGGKYRYPTVTAAEHQALMAAESKGKHLRANIVGKHKPERLDNAG